MLIPEGYAALTEAEFDRRFLAAQTPMLRPRMALGVLPTALIGYVATGGSLERQHTQTKS